MNPFAFRKRREQAEERNRQSGIAFHTAAIAEWEAELAEAIAWHRDHPTPARWLRADGSPIFDQTRWPARMVEHSRTMLAMYENPTRYAASRRVGRVV